MARYHHERLYRSEEGMARLAAARVSVCGAGALGANAAESLVRAGVGGLIIIDRDRVEERNLSTQPYHIADIGARKAIILAHSLYRAVGTEVEARPRELTTANVGRMLQGADPVLETFDNSVSRRAVYEHCRQHSIPCLHAGMAEAYAEIIWNKRYLVPSDANDDVCDYPLARNLVSLTVAVVCECLITRITSGGERSFTVTLKDLAINPYRG